MNHQSTSHILYVVERLSKQYLSDVSALSSTDFEQPSKCHMWAVKDVVSHLVSINGFFQNSVVRSLGGDGMPPEGMPNPGTGSAVTMGEGIANRAIQLSETALSNRSQMIDISERMETESLETFKNVNTDEWDLPAYHPMNTLSPRLLLLLKLFELSIHSWDVFNALDDNYQIDPEAADILIEVWKSPEINRWFFTPNIEQIDPVIMDVEFESNKGLRLASWSGTLDIMNRPSESTSAETTIKVTPSLFSLLITARANLESNISDGNISLAGDKSTVRWFHTWFRGS